MKRKKSKPSLRCSLCKSKCDESATTVKTGQDSFNWELELCDICRMDLLAQLFNQFLIEQWNPLKFNNMIVKDIERVENKIDKLEEDVEKFIDVMKAWREIDEGKCKKSTEKEFLKELKKW